METLSAIPGFDVAKLESFNEHAAANPNAVVLGLEAKTYWEGRSGESLAKVGPWALAGQRIEKPSRDYSIQFGGWKEVLDAIGIEGASDKIEPVEGALAAVCACVNWAICINAAREGLPIEALEVTARATVDPRVLLGVVSTDEAASCLQTVEMEIAVRGAELSEADVARIQDMAKRSPVHAMISHENTILTRVSVN